MENSTSKWIRFGLGASPTLIFILMSLVQEKTDAGPTIFLASIFYLFIGLIISGRMNKGNPDKEYLSKSFTAGVISGFIASFILSVTVCFSTIG